VASDPHGGMPSTAVSLRRPAAARSEIEEIIRRGAIRAVYQPIVDLATREPVGYEALARGPQGTQYESPLALFAAAREAGVVAELEWACRAAAVRGALRAGLPSSLALFLNVEPNLIAAPVPSLFTELLEEARDRLRVVFEITERALAERPAELLRRVQRLRALGGAIAIDDVGADPRSLALMPFLEPDVIKLDLRLVHDRPGPATARVMHAVSAEAERSGAAVVAEGIETGAHLQRAHVLGASLGQGWHFGRPGPLPEAFPLPERLLTSRPPRERRSATPFEIVAARRPVRRGAKSLLLAISREIEARVAQEGEEAVLLATFQDARHFTARSSARYASLAQDAAFVGALGCGLGPHPAAGVRGGHLAAEDRLRSEWNVVVIAPHFAAAFVGRDLGDAGADRERRFDFALTHDRALAVQAAESLMARITPLG
jgi:EAL domain-containing protein (putative c-di-GMP-specific phosphodiesterase class I)